MTRRTLNCLLILTAALAASSFASPSAASGEQSLVYVDRPAAGDAEWLLDAGVTVVHDAGGFLLAVTDETGTALLDRLGFSYDVLDADVSGKTYYTAYPVRSAGSVDVSRYGRVLRRLGPGAILEATQEQAELLPIAGFDNVRVSMTPIRPAARVDRPFFRKSPAQPNPLIQEMVDDVTSSLIDGYVQRLQDFVTRWAPHDSCQAAADWIKAHFESCGIDSVYYQNFSSTYKDNVVAVLPGTTLPDEIIIIGGHYDSVANDPYIASGADDNASGTACVLECARILGTREFHRTLVFIAFGAEEFGLRGSINYAEAAAANGDNIVAMVNVDMIGYLEPGDELDLDIIKNDPSTWLRDRVMNVAANYVPGFPLVDGFIPEGSGSDHMPFWNNGFHAIMFFEDTDSNSPYIHTPGDSIGPSYNSPALAEQSIKVAVALLADLADPVDSSAIGVGEPPPAPQVVVLEQNRPNPFNPRTMIRFTVPSPGSSASLKIYDVSGSAVRALVDDEIVDGTKTVWWDGRNDNGAAVASGVYFYRLHAAGKVLTKKLVLVR
jgi:hypothetical protein